MDVQNEIIGKEMVNVPGEGSVECLVITQREQDPYGYDEEENATLYYYSPDLHRTVKMEAAELSDMEAPQASYTLDPQPVSRAQTFNAKYANPSAVGDDDDEGLNLWLVGGLFILIPLATVGFIAFHRRGGGQEESWDDDDHEGYGAELPSRPQGGATRQGRHCPGCGAQSQYIQAYQRHYCWNCNSYLSDQAAQPQQQPATLMNHAPGGQLCPFCGRQPSYVPQYQRYYCYGCGKYQ